MQKFIISLAASYCEFWPGMHGKNQSWIAIPESVAFIPNLLAIMVNIR